MHTKDTDHDLSALFEMEDEMFTAEPFTKNIMTTIHRHKFRRRIMLSVATLLGGVLAGPQLTAFVNSSDDTSNTISRTLSALPDQFALSQNMSASSLAALTLIVVSAFMISILERA